MEQKKSYDVSQKSYVGTGKVMKMFVPLLQMVQGPNAARLFNEMLLFICLNSKKAFCV